MSDLFDNMTPAQRAMAQRELKFLSDIVEKGRDLDLLLDEWEKAKKVAAQKKALYDQAQAEYNAFRRNGPPKPDPQMKLPFNTELGGLDLPGEIQDLIIASGVGTIEELGMIVRGVHEDYDSVQDISGLTESQADLVMENFRKWYAEQEAQVDQEVEEEFEEEEDFDEDSEAPSVGPNEANADNIDAAEADKKAKVLVEIDQYPFKEGDVIEGKELGDSGFCAVHEGEEFFLNHGEFELV